MRLLLERKRQVTRHTQTNKADGERRCAPWTWFLTESVPKTKYHHPLNPKCTVIWETPAVKIRNLSGLRIQRFANPDLGIIIRLTYMLFMNVGYHNQKHISLDIYHHHVKLGERHSKERRGQMPHSGRQSYCTWIYWILHTLWYK